MTPRRQCLRGVAAFGVNARFGLFTRWFHAEGLLLGRAAGIL
jgi:hypothetical protein